MINRRLIRLCGNSKRYIALTVAAKWLSLLCNIGILWVAGGIVDALITGVPINIAAIITMLAGLAVVRFASDMASPRFSHTASAQAKKTLRSKVYGKLLTLGVAYTSHTTTAGIIQTAGEGIESLDNYFGKYLPQLFYAMLAPVSLFAALSFISIRVSMILLVCVPLIPLSIVAFMRIAKRLMKRYWNVYTDLGDTFLENLQGLTTLKLFGADAKKHQEMNAQSEKFRRITMKVLSTQLHSITLMDILAYGGAAMGGIIALLEYREGAISMGGLITIVLLSAEFFLPLRMLGSFFHVATTSMAASDKIFELLDIPEKEDGTVSIDGIDRISFHHVDFCYEEDRRTLNDICMEIHNNDYIAVVGESGSGKSTLAALIMRMQRAGAGSVLVDGCDIQSFKNIALMQNIGLLSTNSHIFGGTIRDNLLIAAPEATARQMESALRQAQLLPFVKELQKGLDTDVGEEGALLSGGQKQRLALARMLLADRPVMILDEATSNIDCESEEMIWRSIRELKGKKTIIVISHRLATVRDADRIYVMKDGAIAQRGAHEELLAIQGVYYDMWTAQTELESIREVAS